MAASKLVDMETGTGLPRWQLALIVGAPIALGVGAIYLWNRSRKKKSQDAGERKTPEGSASPVQGQDGAAPTMQEQDTRVMLPGQLAFTVAPSVYSVPVLTPLV